MFAVICPDLDRKVLVLDHDVVARTRTHHGTVVEFASHLYAASRYSFEINLVRP